LDFTGQSLQLQGQGNKYEDFRWVGPEKASYSSINAGQKFLPVSNASTGSDAHPSPSPATPGRLENLDLYLESNRRDHHTENFHGTDLFILRRGSTFSVGLKAANLNIDTVIVRFKSYPEGTLITTKVTKDDASDDDNSFSAYVVAQENATTKIAIRIPGTAIVGEYLLSISVDGGKTFTPETHAIILFNAWSKKDTVYMDNEAERNEYVLSDEGFIWVGNHHINSARAWNFAQFNNKSLQAVLKLLKSIPVKQRSDPVWVSRHMSALVNAQDGGVLIGNWSDNYKGGTAPTVWTGSANILSEYLITGKSVGYGQCWVFSGVLTTVMRCLGVPARSVTNFSSGHEQPNEEGKYQRAIDKYFERGGSKINDQKTVDSVWNFHVWNDVWMERPDLGLKYFGWQAIDATPQEESDGTYQTGPAPLIAIKEGEDNISYDLEFIYSEINADEHYYVEKDDGSGYVLARTVTDSIGIGMSTKAVGSNARRDITDDYKYREGSLAERASHRANDTKSGDILTRWEVDDSAEFGAEVKANFILETKASQKRTVHVELFTTILQYTGRNRDNIQTSVKDVDVVSGKPTTIHFNLPAHVYEKYLQGDNSFQFRAYISVKETDQISIILRHFDLQSHDLKIEPANKNLTAGTTSTATISFINKLSIPLTQLVLNVEGQGLTKRQTFKFATLKPGEVLKQTVTLNEIFSGEHLLIGSLEAKELSGIKAHISVNVQ